MFFGVLLLILGALMLLTRLDFIPGDTFDYLWPVVIIALGASMIFKNRKSG